MTISKIFFKRLPVAISRIYDSKTTFVQIPGGEHLFHPLILSKQVFFVGCSPKYLQKYFFPGLFPLVEEVYFHTNIPNKDIFNRKFEMKPLFYVLPHEYELLSHNRVIMIDTDSIINKILN